MFLDSQGIDKYPRNGKGNPRSTQVRIEEFAARQPDVAKLLIAVKWIGNHGSHESSLALSDVLEGAEIFAHAMTMMYDKRPERIRKRAEAYTKRKGKPMRTETGGSR